MHSHTLAHSRHHTGALCTRMAYWHHSCTSVIAYTDFTQARTCALVHSCTLTHSRTRTLARSLVQSHARVRGLTHSCTCVFALLRADERTIVIVHSWSFQTQTLMHFTQPGTRVFARVHVHSCDRVPAHLHTLTSAHYSRTRACAPAHSRKPARTRTLGHLYTRALVHSCTSTLGHHTFAHN